MEAVSNGNMDFSEEVEVLLQDKDYDGALGLIFNPDNQQKVQAFGMDLITRLCEYGVAFCPEFDSLTACQDMLMHVVRSVRPKEALISLLEQAEMFVHYESNKFASLLAPLQHVMLNLPKKREHSFSWVLSILNSHIKSQHKFPAKFKTKLLRGREAIVLEEDSKIKDTLLLYKQFCNFYEPFVRQFWIERTAAFTSKDKDAILSIHRQQDILRDHLVQLLGDPLLQFDLHWENSPPETAKGDPASDPPVGKSIIKTDPRLISERLMGFLRIIDQYPNYYLEWSQRKLFMERAVIKNKPIYTGDDDESDDADSDDCVVDFSSVVNYYYLIFVEGMNKDIIPSVLSPSYVFTSVVRLMHPILSDDKAGPMSLLKCFALAQSLLNNIDEKVRDIRLNSELLETTDITEFIESVAYHTVYSEEQAVRKEGLQVLRGTMWKFEPKGRHDFILFIFNRIEHDGIKGYVISQLKDCIREAVDKKNVEMEEFFTGKILTKLLKLTCFLKNGVTTDLMENKEQIICALNLVVYIAIRDRGTNLTGFTELLGEIRSKLLEPLYKGLELSRAHYQLKLKELNDPKAVEEQLKEHQSLSENMDVVLNDDMITPESIRISINEQKQAVNTALGVFDMMNGVLARVNELCDALEKSMK